MRLALTLTITLAGCSYSVEPIGIARATELCAAAGGLAWVKSGGASGFTKRTFYEGACNDGTGFTFTIKQKE